MKDLNNIKILFVAGFGPIVQNQELSCKLYLEALGISFEEEEGGYFHTENLEGVKHFALWPLLKAAQSCFGSDEWPNDIPVPQAWIEFDVEDVVVATTELQKRGYQLLVSARKEPWGQIITRMLGPEGLLIGVTCTPWMRDKEK